MEKICLIGLGYIGLPAAIIAAESGYKVIGVDINKTVVEKLNNSEMHFSEPFLADILASEVAKGRIKGQLTPEEANAFVIAVPTPFKPGYVPDVSYVEAAAQSIAPFLKKGSLVIIESTVPVGTTEHIRDLLAKARPDLLLASDASEDADVYMAFCPERVLPGNIAYELRTNDRIIGGISEKCSQKATSFYKAFVQGECYQTTARTAEFVKLVENSYRDVNIAFANEVSMISDVNELDASEVIELANKHPRVNILTPGPGVGGHCIAVDPWFIVHKNPDLAQIVHQARKVNLAKTDWVIEQIVNLIKEHKASKLAILGLAYKANADDLRESPAISIVHALYEKCSDATLQLVEPYIDVLPPSLSNFELFETKEAIESADLIVTLVGHDSFKNFKDEIVAKPHLDTVGLLR
ncbi:UDP-N-acetyl-D-mannosamine dehydrogenase [Terasakiella pusilla]|uniref:UDP-N-acetyl-D-mannosamine dehydrogenase n=1 Tax=Terasakiella pusilla TaxID=64973 RepID=UPI00048B2473|nr:UDP-N-acetyl-D-mannosamine dehydrogenase [Terasakiella pusilla]